MLGLSRGNRLHLIQSVTWLWYDRMIQSSYRRAGPRLLFLLLPQKPPARVAGCPNNRGPHPPSLPAEDPLRGCGWGSNRFHQIAGKAGKFLTMLRSERKSIPKCHVIHRQAHRGIWIEWERISFLKKDQDKSKKLYLHFVCRPELSSWRASNENSV